MSLCKNVHLELLTALPVYTAGSCSFVPKGIPSIQIVCQRAGGAGIHYSAHTLSEVMLTCALTPCVSGSNVAYETSEAFVLTEARVVLQYINTFCAGRLGFSF